MGADIHATVAEGLLVKRDDLYASKKTRACKHTPAFLSAGDFCSQCGKPMWVGVTTYIKHFDGVTFAELPLLEPQMCETHALIVTVEAGTASNRSGENFDAAFCKMPDLNNPEIQIKRNKLELAANEAGIWIPENFGIWSVNMTNW